MLAEVDEQSLTMLGCGDVFGEMAVIDGGQRAASARVVKKTQLYSLSRKDFNILVREKPRFGIQLTLNIARILSQRVRQTKNDYRKMLTYSLNR
jgi:CRP-like cAMP-binding protein